MDRVLVLAPQGRDAAVAGALLREAGILSKICASLSDFEHALGNEIHFCVVTEEAIRSAELRAVAAFVSAQPAWSDLPFIILTHRGEERDHSAAAGWSHLLGNVTFLERPFRAATFVSVARTALKGRQRQYEARARIEQLHEGEERLRTALLAGRLGSWELDLESGTLTTSTTCKALFGRGADEPFSYADLLSSIHPHDKKHVQEAVRNCIDNGADCDVEYRTIWPDGGIHWAEMRARRVRDLSNRASRLVGVSSDITERKAAEDSLKRLTEILEERVAERTVELNEAHAAVLSQIKQRERTEELLRQSQKLDMIGQLTGGVAHDFNNLLTVVMGNLSLLRKRPSNDARALRLIDGALQGTERGAALTQRLLAFARRQDLNLEPRDLSELVRGMSNLIERSVGSEVELRQDLPETAPLVLVDANQFELALLNLVVNARDAISNGGVITIKVDTKEPSPKDELAKGFYVRLSVSDNGHGMDDDTLRKATEPFFTTKGPGKGTGLGLSMIHGLASQMNGALRLKSELGRGTTAQLWLPVTHVSGIERQTEPAPQAKKADGPKITVLVVDDDALIAMSTVDMLEDLGHHRLFNAQNERRRAGESGLPTSSRPSDLIGDRLRGATGGI